MRCPALLLTFSVAALACSSSDQTVADSTAADVASENTTLASMAGTWNMRTMAEQGDSTLLTYVVHATSDTTGWTVTFPGREAIPARVMSVDADSVVIEVGPYESALRPGVQVTTRSVSRVQGDRMTGTAVARYQGVTTADSVVRLRVEGTRAP